MAWVILWEGPAITAARVHNWKVKYRQLPGTDTIEPRCEKTVFFCCCCFDICENKDADQLRSNCAADQRLCFRHTDSTIPLLPKSEISSL